MTTLPFTRFYIDADYVEFIKSGNGPILTTRMESSIEELLKVYKEWKTDKEICNIRFSVIPANTSTIYKLTLEEEKTL